MTHDCRDHEPCEGCTVGMRCNLHDPGQFPDEAGGLDACVSCGMPVLELVPLIEHAAGCTARPAGIAVETNPTAIVAEIDHLEALLSDLYRRRDTA